MLGLPGVILGSSLDGVSEEPQTARVVVPLKKIFVDHSY